MDNIFYTIIIYPIVLIIEFIFVFANEILKETGFAIFCVSVVISVLCLPLYMIAEKWQEIEREIQRTFAHKIARIKSVFKSDERYMILSTFYRQNHYHPVYALRGSFGLLFQIPFFIAAYTYLSHLELLQGLSFYFISDLSKPDALIPLAGGINLLPVLMALINCLSGIVYTRGLGIKDKIQVYGIALVFVVLLYNSPSALVLYWTLNNIFSLLKNLYLNLKFKYKQYIIYIFISIIFFSLSYYSLFILLNNFNVRLLISIISLLIGILPWIIKYIKFLNKFKLDYKKNHFLLFIFSILIIWSSISFFTPSMLINSSPQEFSYIDEISSPINFSLNTLFQGFGLFIFWPIIVYLLISEKYKTILSLIMAFFSISVLCNIFIFFGDYGPISNSLTFSGNPSHNLFEKSINLLVIILLCIIILIIYLRGYIKFYNYLNIFIFSAILIISIINIININNEYNKLSEYYKPIKKTEETIKPIISLSKTSKNVIIIMLDKAVSVFIPHIFEESPELKQYFNGFTFFPNTVSFDGYTKGGAPPIFGGYEYTPQGINNRPNVSFKDKLNESLLLLPRIFSHSGFNVTITDPPYANNNWIPDLRIFDNDNLINGFITDGVYTDLWLKNNNFNLPAQSSVLKRNLLWYSIFRSAPLAFRLAIYYKGSWCAPKSENWIRTFINGYAVLDFLPKLTEFNSSKNNNTFIMTNNTTHETLFLQAPEYRPQQIITNYGTGRFNNVNRYHANAAAIKRLSEYFIFLKENNVYDNTRIIIVSDHGAQDITYVTKTSLPFHVDNFNSVLFFKDFNNKGDLIIDMSFMSTADVPFLAMNNLIEDPVNPFTGNKIIKNNKVEPLLILIDSYNIKNNSLIDLNGQNSYYVNDNIFDEKNWKKAEH